MKQYKPGINFCLILATIFTFINSAQSQSIEDPLKLIKYKEVANKFVTVALTERKGYDVLKNLCRIGPRLSGSKNSLIAINWAKSKMIEMGFDSVWLQAVMVPHWERGNIEEATLVDSNNYPYKKLEITALGGSVGTSPEGITANMLEVKSFDELKLKQNEAKGKIIFFSRPIDPANINTFGGYGDAGEQRFYGAIEGAKYGAVGVIIRSLTTKYDNVPHTGVMFYSDTLPKIPAVAVGYQDADLLSQVLKKFPDLKLNIKLNCEILPDAKSYNVIGEIVGSELPDEIIVVGGHLDSWDVGEGAHDDGAGCIQTVEVLDLFKRLNIKPKRTIRVVLFINEENGSRGSKEYAAYSDSLNLYHLAAIESDRGAFTPRGFTVETDSATFKKLESWLPILNAANIDWIHKGGSGVDILSLNSAKALIGYAPDGQRYFDYHHSANDVFSAVHPREFELGTAAIAILTYLLSEEGL